MSEEEKKAIGYLYMYADDMENKVYDYETTVNIKKVLKLVHEQKEEIKKLKKPKYIMNIETSEITQISNDFISKDKIREKIKELEEYQKQHKEGNWADIPIEDYDFDKINLLKDLLKE